MSTALAMLAAVLLDAVLGEPRQAHPLVLFGRFAAAVEQRLHADRRGAGVLAWSLAVLPPVVLVALPMRAAPVWLAWGVQVVLLYACLGLRSLGEHAMPVAEALSADDLPAARQAVGRMVSRDTEVLGAAQVAAAATESVLENGNDAVFGALFWFAMLGAPGAVLFRLANTLDAMWGYRTPRFLRFGWAAACIDDGLNFVPARLTALTYVATGHAARAWRCWRTQARAWDSPNAGPVMAAGAGAIGVRLGGPTPYHGRWEERPVLGCGARADAGAIGRALQLVRRGVIAWLLVGLVVAALRMRSGHA